MRTIIFLLLFGCLLPIASAHTLEKLFYVTPNEQGSTFSHQQLEHISAHADAIDILAPQLFVLNKQGILKGKIDPQLLQLAQQRQIKLMPLVVNADFNQEEFHLFLHNPRAIQRAINSMLALCKHYHLYGIQFDFENIPIHDKKEFTRFFKYTANRLHKHGFIISIAVIPRTSDQFVTDYDRWVLDNWSGAYDYKQLGYAADFISVMSYDKHTSLTTPGPIAPLDWVEKTIQSLLKQVLPHKISLGIPTYSGYWSSGKLGSGKIPEKYSFRSKEAQISYSKAITLLKEFKQTLIWQPAWQSWYVMYTNNEKNEFLFVEDAKSFEAKHALAERYHLRGFSVWKLGIEDLQIWELN